MPRRFPLRITVHFVGKRSAGALDPALRDYADRVGRLCELSLHIHRNGTIREEAKSLRRAIGDSPFVALHPEGRAAGSEDILRFLREALSRADHRLCVVIGGAAGLPPEILSEATHRWSLSRLTLSHDLARLVLLEQIYRALATLAGSPYAK